MHFQVVFIEPILVSQFWEGKCSQSPKPKLVSTAPKQAMCEKTKTWILQGSEIWSPKNPPKTDRLRLKFDTQTEGLGTWHLLFVFGLDSASFHVVPWFFFWVWTLEGWTQRVTVSSGINMFGKSTMKVDVVPLENFSKCSIATVDDMMMVEMVHQLIDRLFYIISKWLVGLCYH